MPIRDLASDRIYFQRNDEAAQELIALGFQMPAHLKKVFALVDNLRTFMELINHPSLLEDELVSDAIRSLIKIGLIIPTPATNAENEDTVDISATQRLRMIAAATEPSVSDSQAFAAIAATTDQRKAWKNSLDTQALDDVKATLLFELRRVLGRDVDLVQIKIMSANNADDLMKSVGVCARILEAAISPDVSQKFVAIFKRHFSE
jgi:fumarylacetoacetate (FAA) hydrolase family protein